METPTPKEFFKSIRRVMSTRKDDVNEIIRTHVLWSMGAGLVPIPVVDVAAVSGVQIKMIQDIGRLYDVELNDNLGRSVLAALTGGTLARLGASAIKALPFVGSVVGGITMSVLSGASTYAVGHVIARELEEQGTLDKLDVNAAKKVYDEAFERGKEFAERLETESRRIVNLDKAPEKGKAKPATKSPASASVGGESDTDVFSKIERLSQLKESGVLTEDEFIEQKKRLLQQL